VGQTYEVCGAERLTLEQMLDAILDATGRRRWKVYVPGPAACLQALLLETLVGKLLGQPPPLNRDQLRMLQEDNVGDATSASRTFGLTHERFGLGVKGWLTGPSH
jgi:uncharacterized protein YbjT (DUF2867 family)